jgi:pSer/pThr/pTyr-binding forkhead associated (FHA) protein
VASTLVISLVKYGLLTLLWLFVLAAVRVVRTDLSAPARPGPAPTDQKVRPDRKERKAKKAAEPAGKRSLARTLVVTEGALAGTTVGLGAAPVTLGRADDSTLVLTDDYASSHHARLVPGEGTWLLEDLGSTNGTYLGNTKVSRPTPVPLGAQIRIGKTVLELRR